MAKPPKGKPPQRGKREDPRAAPVPVLGRRFPLWAPVAFAAALFALGFLIYQPALSGTFVFDDFDLREGASTVRLGDFGLLVSSGRPVLMATYVANHRLSGFEPYPFHFTNIFLHCLNALLLWRLLASLFAAGPLDDLAPRPLRSALIYGVPLLFLTSPIQTESVAYISSRSELLAATFFLAALWVFVSPLRERHPWTAALLVLFFFAGSLGSKQDKLILPLVILLLDYLLIARLDWRRLRDNWRIYGLFLAGGVAGFLLVIRPFLFAQSAGFTLDWQPYLYTQFRMYFLYLKLLLVPFGLNADHDIVASTSLGEHLSWLALLLLIALMAAVARYHRRAPLIAFGTLFFFVVLAPTSSFFPILDYAAERRLYLPSVGFFLAVLPLLFWLLRPSGRVLAGLLAVGTMVYAVGTHQRSQVWADELSLWRDTVQKSPAKYRPWTWLGKVQNERGDYTGAIQSWENAAALAKQGSSDHAHLLNNLGLAYANLQDRARAVAYYQRALAILPNEGQFWANLAVAQLRLNDQQGWQSFEKAVQHARGRSTVFLLRGQEYFQAGRYGEAAADFQHALAIQPEDETARRNLEAAKAMLRRTQSP